MVRPGARRSPRSGSRARALQEEFEHRGIPRRGQWFEDEVARWAVPARLTNVGETANRRSADLSFAVEWHVGGTIVDRPMPELIAYVTELLGGEFPGLGEGLRGSA